MANNIVKIYELKTIGYDEVAGQLQNVNNLFEQVRQTKIKLNQTKLSTDDKKTIDDTVKAINEEKLRTKELQLQKQQLKNEAIALNNIRQAEINKAKEAALAVKSEAGSYTDLINKQKELFNLLKNSNPGGAPGAGIINFRGARLSYEEGRALYQQMGVDAKNQLNFLKGINAEFEKTPGKIVPIRDAGQQMTSAINNGLASLKGNLSQVIFMYTGWFAAFREVGALISENKSLSDTFADLQIRIHGTRDDVEQLVAQLRQISTRTSLQGLTEIAAIVSKKGVPREELAGLTKEFDKLNVVLGKELGEPETAVANIIKLITVFNDDKHVTAGRVNEIATSLFKLTTSGVATGEFLVNFAERVGAVRGITGITLPNVLAMGAAMQQLGQRVELSSTALIQLTTKIFANVPKYAAAANKSVEEFRNTLRDNPFEALTQVAEGLKDLPTDEIAVKAEEIVQAFQEVGVTGSRIKAVLSDIATNADFVRERMKTAAVSTEDYARMNEAATLKQNTFAASLDKVRKSLELIGTSTAVQTVLAAIASLILLLTSHIGLIIGVLATYAGMWVIANSEMIAARIATVASNVAFMAQYAILVVSNTFMQAYTATIGLFTGAMTRATAATTLFRAALSLLGIGIVITAIAALAGLFTTLKASVTGSIDKLKEFAKQQAVQADINAHATETIRDQMATLTTYSNVVLSASASLDTKKKAMEELIKMNDKFREAINGDIIDLNKFKQILNETKDAIQLNARAMAAADLTKQKFQDVLVASSLRQRIETVGAQGGGTIKLGELTDAEKKLIEAIAPKAPRNSLDYDFFFNMTGIIVDKKNLKKWQDLFKGIEGQMTDVYNQYQLASVDLQNKVNAQNAENEAKLSEAAKKSLEDRIKAAQTTSLTGQELENLIGDINKAIPKYKEGDAKIKELADARDALQKRLDEFRLKKKGGKAYSGARLSGTDRDELNEIEAARRLALAQAEADFSELQADHRATYEEEIAHANNIHAINSKYLDQKIKYLNGLGTLNAKELEQMATFRKEKADETLKYQKDVQAILDREYNLEAGNLKGKLTNQINDIQTRNAGVQGDASLTAEQRAQSKLNSDREILALQENFNVAMDALEKKFNQKSRENADEGARTRQQIMQDTIDILNARIKDADDAADKLNDEFRTRAADKAIDILKSGKSNAAIARDLKKLNDDLARDLLASDVARLKIELDLYKEGKDGKIKTEKEYQEALRKYKEAEQKLVEVTQQKELTALEKFKKAIKDFVGGLGENVFGIKKYTDDVEGEAEKQQDAYDQAYKAIGDAISEAERGYFEGLNAQVEREHDVQSERLAAEKAQVQARAQSQAEKESIDKQYAAKQKALDKAESERKKQIALKQIAIDFAVSVIKAIAQYGLPLALIPIAAETALYFVQRANIQKQTFARGGWLSDGGEIHGPSHGHGGVKFTYNEAEGKELAIINKKSATSGVNYQVSGTPKQIASAINWIGGGTNFAPGGKIFRKWADGGILGSAYTAPVYTPSNQVSADFSSYHNDIVGMTKAINERIDNIEVTLDSDKVTNNQKKTKLKNEIGTL